MTDSINTHYKKGGFALSDDIELSVSKRTRVIFRPGIHKGGVRGKVIRQKIGENGKWKDVNEVNFTKLPADCGVSIDLNTDATDKLFKRLTSLYQVQSQGIAYGNQKYVVGKQEEVLIVDDKNKAKAIQEILDKGYSEEFWEELIKKDPDLATRLSLAQIHIDRQKVIDEFEKSMTEHAGDESYWQSFFEKNPWILQSVFSAPVFMLQGEAYLGGKGPIGRQGTGGVATDYLFSDESTKSFAVVDIKTPDKKLIGSIYRGEPGSGHDKETYSAHAELSGGVIQVRNQITVAVDNFQSVLGPEYKEKMNRVHPKGILIIGDTNELDQRQMDSFNQFRQGLYSLTVITYDELLKRLRILFDVQPDSDRTQAEQTTKTENKQNIDETSINLDDIPF